MRKLLIFAKFDVDAPEAALTAWMAAMAAPSTLEAVVGGRASSVVMNQRIDEAPSAGGIHVASDAWDAIAEYVFAGDEQPFSKADLNAAMRPLCPSDLIVDVASLWVDPITMVGEDGDHPIVRFVMLRRAAGVSPAAFSAYWRNEHGTLVTSYDAIRTRMRHYIQNHVIFDLVRAEPLYDGVVESQYDSLDDTRAVLSDPAIAASIVEDELKFIDRDAMVMLRARRRVLR